MEVLAERNLASFAEVTESLETISYLPLELFNYPNNNMRRVPYPVGQKFSIN